MGVGVHSILLVQKEETSKVGIRALGSTLGDDQSLGLTSEFEMLVQRRHASVGR